MTRLAPLSRRQFASTVASALGALSTPRVEASLPADAPADAIQLNSNENPYGPSPRALEAFTRSSAVASRYPDAAERRLYGAVAAGHGVTPE